MYLGIKFYNKITGQFILTRKYEYFYSMLKIMKCARTNDVLTIKTQRELDSIIFIFESQNYDEVSNYQLRLMNLEHEHLDIPVSYIKNSYFVCIYVCCDETKNLN